MSEQSTGTCISLSRKYMYPQANSSLTSHTVRYVPYHPEVLIWKSIRYRLGFAQRTELCRCSVFDFPSLLSFSRASSLLSNAAFFTGCFWIPSSPLSILSVSPFTLCIPSLVSCLVPAFFAERTLSFSSCDSISCCADNDPLGSVSSSWSSVRCVPRATGLCSRIGVSSIGGGRSSLSTCEYSCIGDGSSTKAGDCESRERFSCLFAIKSVLVISNSRASQHCYRGSCSSFYIVCGDAIESYM